MTDLVDMAERFWDRRSKWGKGLIMGGLALVSLVILGVLLG
jgi:hypothetical protein